MRSLISVANYAKIPIITFCRSIWS
nr:hypothetical protein BAR15_150030 [Bartonella sp. AR 15-3]